MFITVNGNKEKIKKGSTISDYLALKKLKPQELVVDLNGELVSEDNYLITYLKDDDQLEILRFVGGG